VEFAEWFVREHKLVQEETLLEEAVNDFIAAAAKKHYAKCPSARIRIRIR
jgi:hypothetical protein